MFLVIDSPSASLNSTGRMNTSLPKKISLSLSVGGCLTDCFQNLPQVFNNGEILHLRQDKAYDSFSLCPLKQTVTLCVLMLLNLPPICIATVCVLVSRKLMLTLASAPLTLDNVMFGYSSAASVSEVTKSKQKHDR